MRTLPLVAGLAVSLVVGAPRGARAEDDDLLAGISGAKALEYAKELASDAMKGRRTGGEGGQRSETWMQSKLSELALDPMDPDGSYLWTFPFGTTEVAAPIAFEVDGQAVEYGKDFVELGYTGAGKVEAPVVFVGYGIVAKERGWDDYDGVDVKGKIVLAIRGAPTARESEFATERQIGWKSAAAADRGAVGFLLAEGAAPASGTIQQRFHRAALPSVWVSAAAADKILAKRERTLADLKASRDKGEPGRSFATDAKVRLEVNARFNPNAQGRDVIGGVFGKDPDLRHEVVVIGAHLDHLGVDVLGRVFNGADDNASGCASLVVIAETLMKNRWRPRRTVVFAFFAGEEQGLVGSRALARDTPFAGTIVAMLNIDMTGQGRPEIALGGGEAYPAVFDLAVAGMPEALRKTVTPFRATDNSDHWPFYERGIPALFAHTSGDHPNYHQVTDDVENLKPECMEAAARAMGGALVALVDHPEPLATGREAAGLVLREGARVVSGAASEKALAGALATGDAGVAGQRALVRAGHACVIALLDEKQGGAAVAWAKLSEKLAGRRDVALVRTASDLANAARGARTAVLPLLACATSAAAHPPVLKTYHDLGVRWVAPFDAAAPVADGVRNAILDSAAVSKLVIDLTGLPLESIPRALGRPTKETMPPTVATLRVTAPLAKDAAAARTALTELRKAAGPGVLVLVSGGAEEALLAPDALAAPEPDGLAPVAIVADDTERLAELLAVAKDETAPYADPAAASRQRLRGYFGGAFVDLLRRLR